MPCGALRTCSNGLGESGSSASAAATAHSSALEASRTFVIESSMSSLDRSTVVNGEMLSSNPPKPSKRLGDSGCSSGGGDSSWIGMGAARHWDFRPSRQIGSVYLLYVAYSPVAGTCSCCPFVGD